MKSIYKYPVPVPVADVFILSMPKNAEVLCVQMQHGNPCIWALVDTNETEMENVYFRLAGTGHPIRDEECVSKYVGTFQMNCGNLVFHIFILK